MILWWVTRGRDQLNRENKGKKESGSVMRGKNNEREREKKKTFLLTWLQKVNSKPKAEESKIHELNTSFVGLG